MTKHETTKERPDAQAMEAWLCNSIANRLKLPAVDPELPLSNYNLNSMTALRLLDELEAWLGESFPATIFFDYPNVRRLSCALAAGEVTQSDDYVAPDADCY